MHNRDFSYKIAAFLSLIFFGFSFIGCGESLRTLQALGSEQQAQQKLISSQRRSFESLLRDIKNSRLKIGLARKYLISKYGQPVLSTNVEYTSGEDDTRMRLLYRDPVGYVDSTKIYLEFNDNDKLINFRLQEATGNNPA